MLKKQNRLSKISHKKAGIYLTSQLFNIKVFDNGENLLRFGFVVSKKISKSAVKRNKTKRILRDGVKAFLGNLELGKDIVIFAKSQLAREQKQEVEKSLKESFKKAKIYK